MRPETHHAVIRISYNDHIATGVALTPLPCPQIQHVVKIDIRQQRRYYAHNNRANSRVGWGLRIARESLAPRFAGCPDVEIVLVIEVIDPTTGKAQS
ncbi:hypothetical protein PVE_R2G0732 [Pseudomonas veronii 1YdBTEX2]|uniref:Uncharacterized protein n=1 Tax=Pseudomonas veronii 1YdBTEX2 TaxID=1295141 RepID=A0A1D3K8W4_PSEVE|nr:hypothetical protein PVE_R2G0732 [Pseudomonas veronii 1YdBTEX2]